MVRTDIALRLVLLGRAMGRSATGHSHGGSIWSGCGHHAIHKSVVGGENAAADPEFGDSDGKIPEP
jgi:hypothetical protein